MDSTPTQVYEDFVPSTKLVQEEHSDTLHLTLQGFKKQELRVELTKTGILKISGQRPVETPNKWQRFQKEFPVEFLVETQGFKIEELRVELTKTGILKISGQRPVEKPNKWQRFQKEFPVAVNCDRSKISAKFVNGILHVKQPKMITSPVEKDNELAATLAENTTSRDEFSKQDNADINTPAKEETNKFSPKTSEQTEAKLHSEKNLPTDKSSSSSSSYSESTDDETIGNASCLAANVKKPRKVMKMTLVALSILGIGIYIAIVMKSANEAEE